MSRNAERFIGLWLCLDAVEQDALYDLLVHRTTCGQSLAATARNGGPTDA